MAKFTFQKIGSENYTSTYTIDYNDKNDEIFYEDISKATKTNATYYYWFGITEVYHLDQFFVYKSIFSSR